jgi:DNA-binding NtrC family response regulator
MMSESSRDIQVILVDDEADLVNLLATRLNKRDIEAVATTSGKEALAVCRERNFDVAIVDLKMPDMDGVEVMQKLKAMQPFIETIMFTGHGNTDSALEAGKLDTYRYIMKPCDFDELVALIREAWTHRRHHLRILYQQELQKVMEHSSTPRDILDASEELRRKYEQD